MLRAGALVQRRLRWGTLGLATLLAVAAISTDADARGRRHRQHAPRRPKLRALLFLHRGRRQFRRGDAGDQRRQSAPSGLADQDHDALPAVRAAGGGQDQAHDRNAGLRPCRRAGAVQAGLEAGPEHRGGNRDPRHRHQIGQRRGGDRRRNPRRRRSRIRQADDRQGARARHEAHDLPQRVRPARGSADHHRARPGHSRPRHPGSLPEILSPIFPPGFSPSTAR